MGTKLERIAEISAETKKPVFTSIYHLINAELLKQCHKELDGKKAVGVDKVTKEEYGKNLDRNIEDLVQRLKNIIEGIYSKGKWKNATAGNSLLRG